MKNGLPLIINQHTTKLILGTFPGEFSLATDRYYAHPRNLFWKLMQFVFPDLPYSYPDQIDYLLEHQIGLWDVIQSADRKGSLDTAIRHYIPNDFELLFRQYPKLCKIGFSSKKAAILFIRTMGREWPKMNSSIELTVLPSPSPANAGKSWAFKQERWQSFLLADS